MDFLIHNLGNIVVLLLVGIATFFAVRGLLRQRKQGGCSACGSAGCSCASHCSCTQASSHKN